MNTKTRRALLGLTLLGAASAVHAAPNCTIRLKGDDRMQFDLKTVTVSTSCPKITVELTHVGKLDAKVMGHNVVIGKTADVGALSTAGMKAGVVSHYVPKGDARVIAATTVIGGGGATRTSFPGSKLQPGGDYTFFCSFPGHAAIMRGKLVVTK